MANLSTDLFKLRSQAAPWFVLNALDLVVRPSCDPVDTEYTRT